MKKRVSRTGRGRVCVLPALLLSAVLCACGSNGAEQSQQPSQTAADIQYTWKPSEVLQSAGLTEGQSLTVLGGGDNQILAAIDTRYPEGHPYAREMGISSYSTDLLMADLSDQSFQTVYTCPEDTIGRAGAIYNGGIVVAQMLHTGESMFRYELVQISGQKQNSIYQGRCTDLSGLTVLSDRAVVHAYHDREETLEQGVVVTSLDGTVLYHGRIPLGNALLEPLFCSDGTYFALCAHGTEGDTVLVGDADGLLHTFSLAPGEVVSEMAFLNQQLLLLVSGAEPNSQHRQLRSLEGELVAETRGSPLFHGAGAGHVVAGVADGGIVLLHGELQSQWIDEQTDYQQLLGLAPGRFFLYDRLSGMARVLQVAAP